MALRRCYEEREELETLLLTLEQTRAACLGCHWESAIHDYMGMPRSTLQA